MELFVIAAGLSMDAFATGVTFAFLDVSIIPAIILIGAITFGFLPLACGWVIVLEKSIVQNQN